jgi:hypothetical protein
MPEMPRRPAQPVDEPKPLEASDDLPDAFPSDAESVAQLSDGDTWAGTYVRERAQFARTRRAPRRPCGRN